MVTHRSSSVVIGLRMTGPVSLKALSTHEWFESREYPIWVVVA